MAARRTMLVLALIAMFHGQSLSATTQEPLLPADVQVTMLMNVLSFDRSQKERHRDYGGGTLESRIRTTIAGEIRAF
jgi:hypothetical protein